MPLFVDVEAHFGAVKPDGTGFEPAGAELFGQAIEEQNLGRPFADGVFGRTIHRGMVARQGEIVGRGLAVAFNQGLRFLISEATIALDDRFCDVKLEDFGSFVHFENGGIGQFFLVGAKRTDEIAQPLGEHGDGAVDKIDTCGTIVGFAVERAVFFHIVTHVGDVHTHLPSAVAHGAYGKRIVEIFGIAGVDGESGNGAEIFAAGNFGRRDARLEMLRGALDGLRIAVRKSVFGQDGVHLGVVFSLGAENIHHFAHRTLAVFGPICDLNDGFVAGFSAVEGVGGDKNVGGQSAFVDQKGVIALYMEASHEGFASAADDFGHFCLASVSAAAGQHGDTHVISVECVVGVAFCHEDIFSSIVGNEYIVPVALATEHTFYNLHVAFCVTVVACAVSCQIIVGNQVG